jgi:DNA-directed RNA polymerase subunit N (RpoN/RPB10)
MSSSHHHLDTKHTSSSSSSKKKEEETKKTTSITVHYRLRPIRCTCGEFLQHYASEVDRLLAQGFDLKTAIDRCGLPKTNWYAPPPSANKTPEYHKRMQGAQDVCCRAMIFTTINCLETENFYHAFKLEADEYFS